MFSRQSLKDSVETVRRPAFLPVCGLIVTASIHGVTNSIVWPHDWIPGVVIIIYTIWICIIAPKNGPPSH